jgi:3-oxoacyl-[acyl-carrier-protein] synthase II
MEGNNHNGHHRRVVITGLGAVTPVGLDIPTLWDSVVNGRSGVGYITSFDTKNFLTKFGAEVKNFDPTCYVNRKQVKHMDRFTQFAVAACLQAVESARLKVDQQNAEETGVIIGNSVAGLLSVCDQYRILAESGPDRVSPAFAPTMTGDAAAVQTSLLLGTKGVNYSPSSACASGLDAIGQGVEVIRDGRAKVIIAGGTEVPIIPLVIAAFNAIRALSIKNEKPHEACRPFDMGRDGFVMGEGAAMMVLEDRETALERGAPILAEVIGYGSSSDAFHLVQPSPDGAGATRAVKMALSQSDITSDGIDYIHAHGTATLLNDRVETSVIKKVFGERAQKIPVSASKSMTGHLLGASGSLGAVITVLSMKNGMAPPTINLTNPDPECDLDFVPNQARPVKMRTAMVNSFGFGGHNAVLIIRQPNLN